MSSLTAHQHDKGADAPGVNKSQLVVTTGVAIASYGEINFVVIGVVLQLIDQRADRVHAAHHGPDPAAGAHCIAPPGNLLHTCHLHFQSCHLLVLNKPVIVMITIITF